LPYADNYGVKIFYIDEGEGPPIVLHHGLAGTHLDWIMYNDYIKALKDRYRLLAIDARGRGKSDKRYAPEEHSMKHYVGDVTAVLDAAGLDKAHFWGYSMGGRVGLATGKYAPDRFSSLIIGGSGLSEKDSEGEVEELKPYIRRYEEFLPIYKQGREAVTSYTKETRGEDVEGYAIERLLNADPRALLGYCFNYENIGMADYLPGLSTPCLLYAGEEDTYPHSTAKTCAEIMQNATFVSLPGLDHGGAFLARDQVLPHVLKFLEGV
jgi:pimeloyl-ACP methyl ester carboxylesterase